MYKHILIPTDGSETAQLAVDQGIAFAKEVGARITALSVYPPYDYLALTDELVPESEAENAEKAKEYALKLLASVAELATAKGVMCQTVVAESEHPSDEIIKTATDHHCDLIAMSSHGRRGLSGLFIGSETQKVMTHTTIPMLVFR